MDATSFRWLIHFTIQRSLHMRLMDVVTAYLYGDLDKDIYMKIHGELCKSMQRQGLLLKVLRNDLVLII